MFLTKKGFWKIAIMAIAYFLIGSFSFAAGIFLSLLGGDAALLFWLGAFVYAFGVLLVFWGRYSEGKGKLLYSALRLIRVELKPAEFIKKYEDLKNSPDLIVNKPDFDVLQMVTVAYDCLGDQERALATVDEMLAIASPKKQAYAKLIKASYLYSYRKIDEAERLFNEAQKSKLDVKSNLLMDAILKNGRAMAMEDYPIVESYCLKLLDQKLPKPDNLGKLIIHHTLGEAYEKSQAPEKAASHYRYCVQHGGETAIKESAQAALERIEAFG